MADVSINLSLIFESLALLSSLYVYNAILIIVSLILLGSHKTAGTVKIWRLQGCGDIELGSFFLQSKLGTCSRLPAKC